MTDSVLLAEESVVAKCIEFLLGLSHESVESCFHVGQFVSNVVHQDL